MYSQLPDALMISFREMCDFVHYLCSKIAQVERVTDYLSQVAACGLLMI
jgi:hypothetical protein